MGDELARRASVTPKLNQGHATLLPIPSIPFLASTQAQTVPLPFAGPHVVVVIIRLPRPLLLVTSTPYLVVACCSSSPPSSFAWPPPLRICIISLAHAHACWNGVPDRRAALNLTPTACLAAARNWLLSSQLGTQNGLANPGWPTLVPESLTCGCLWNGGRPISATPPAPWAY